MQSFVLYFFTRKGCCLCEGLEKKLKDFCFQKLSHPLVLQMIDIDDPGTSKVDKDNFSLDVPVLIVKSQKSNQNFRLPRVSPRLNGEGFSKWLQKSLEDYFEKSY